MTTDATLTPDGSLVAALGQARDWVASIRARLVAVPESELPAVFTGLLALRGAVEGLGVAAWSKPTPGG